MANEIKLNSNNELLLNTVGDSNELLFNEVSWYEPTADTVRYYKLDDTTDSAGNGDLTNNGSVDFSNGYADFNNTPGKYLIDTTFSKGTSTGQLDSEFTIFCWYYIYDGLSKNAVFGIDGSVTGAQFNFKCYQPDNFDSNNCYYGINTTTYYGATSNSCPTNEWIFGCLVRSGTTGITYTGTTTNTYKLNTHVGTAPTLNLMSDYTQFVIGADPSAPNTKMLSGRTSGMIIENKPWTQAELEAQVAKGPYCNYG